MSMWILSYLKMQFLIWQGDGTWAKVQSFAGAIKPDEHPFNTETRRLWVASYLDCMFELIGQQKVAAVVVEKMLVETEFFHTVRFVLLQLMTTVSCQAITRTNADLQRALGNTFQLNFNHNTAHLKIYIYIFKSR